MVNSYSNMEHFIFYFRISCGMGMPGASKHSTIPLCLGLDKSNNLCCVPCSIPYYLSMDRCHQSRQQEHNVPFCKHFSGNFCSHQYLLIMEIYGLPGSSKMLMADDITEIKGCLDCCSMVERPENELEDLLSCAWCNNIWLIGSPKGIGLRNAVDSSNTCLAQVTCLEIKLGLIQVQYCSEKWHCGDLCLLLCYFTSDLFRVS